MFLLCCVTKHGVACVYISVKVKEEISRYKTSAQKMVQNVQQKRNKTKVKLTRDMNTIATTLTKKNEQLQQMQKEFVEEHTILATQLQQVHKHNREM